MGTKINFQEFMAGADADAVEIELPTGKPIVIPPAVRWADRYADEINRIAKDESRIATNDELMRIMIGDVEGDRFLKADGTPAAFHAMYQKAKEGLTAGE